MTLSSKWPWIVVGLSMAVLGCDAITGSTEVYEHYEDLESAQHSKVIERGWLPGWLPPSTSDIHLLTDVDLNLVWSRFDVSPEDLRGLVDRFPEADASQARRAHEAMPTRVDWWKVQTVQERENLALYVVKEAGGEVAFLGHVPGTQRLYYWLSAR